MTFNEFKNNVNRELEILLKDNNYLRRGQATYIVAYDLLKSKDYPNVKDVFESINATKNDPFDNDRNIENFFEEIKHHYFE